MEDLSSNFHDDVWLAIFQYLDLRSIAKVCLVCKRFNHLASSNFVWKSQEKYFINNLNVLGQSLKRQCQISRKWAKGQGYQFTLKVFNKSFMPWLQLSDDKASLFMSIGDEVVQYQLHQKLKRYGKTLLKFQMKYVPLQEMDVYRFRSKGNLFVGGGWDGFISWYHGSPSSKFIKCDSHTKNITALDVRRANIISGSFGSLKIWTLTDNFTQLRQSFATDIDDKVLSVAINPVHDEFVLGTGGIHSHPLQLWDLNRFELISDLGMGYKLGAGVLDLQHLDPNKILSAGYDTYIRMFDLRVSHSNAVAIWEEPHDNTIYCITSDSGHMIVSGSCRHGVVRIWDTRRRRCLQTFYFGSQRTNSPVYSVQFTRTHLFAALARGLHAVEFT